MPGAGFKTLAKQWQKAFNDMVEVPYNFTRKMIVSFSRCMYVPTLIIDQADGSAPTSYISLALENEDDLRPQDISDIKHVAASMYGGQCLRCIDDHTLTRHDGQLVQTRLFPHNTRSSLRCC